MSDGAEKSGEDVEIDEGASAEAPAPPAEPGVYVLECPVEWGQEGTVSRLKLQANGRAMQGFRYELGVSTDGKTSIVFDPYRFAELGVRLAGKPRAFVDSLHPVDQHGLGMVALGFFSGGLGIGRKPSR